MDKSGNAYVTGYTSTSSGYFYSERGFLWPCDGQIIRGILPNFPFPTTNAYKSSNVGSDDAFVVKFNASGGLVYSTYLGGALSDGGSGIAVDQDGSAYVTGNTYSADFPTTPYAYKPSLSGYIDAFVTKFDAFGALVYSTYLGGNDQEAGSGVAVDKSGNTYVTGQTSSTDFPSTPDAYKRSLSGDIDAFVTILNASGNGLLYSTYLGGYRYCGWHYGYGIAVDGSRNVYITGGTCSTDFPITPDAYQGRYGGGYYDAFVVKLGPTNRPPEFAIIGDKTVNEGELLQFTVTATDADGDALTYSASKLPTGATFDPATQTFSWIPSYTQAGNYTNVRFTVTDNGAPPASAWEAITITVGNVNRPPVLSAIGSKTVNEGELLQFTVTATDPDGDALTYSASNLPTGATFDPATQKFSWIPSYTQAGNYSGIGFLVTDGSAVDDEKITIIVNDVAPIRLLGKLIDYVKSLNLPKGIEQSLTSKLENAIKSMEKGQENAAINQINAFINEVRAQRGKNLTFAQADNLVKKAKDIILNNA